jgi:hypothetical protein
MIEREDAMPMNPLSAPLAVKSAGRRRDVLKSGLAAAAALATPAFVDRPARAQVGDGRTPTVTEDVARWLVALRYDELPPDVIARAKRVLLDTLGCALGAVGAAPVRAAQQVVALQGGNPQATILGLGRKVSCDQAAFLNGMALRYFDYNDYIALGRPNHASINVAPALAIAEMQGATGKALLLGLVAGYELEVRLRDAIAARRREGFDDTSIEAQYAAAATAGKLLQLDEVKLANALAIAGSNANTLAEVRRGAELTPAKGAAAPRCSRKPALPIRSPFSRASTASQRWSPARSTRRSCAGARASSKSSRAASSSGLAWEPRRRRSPPPWTSTNGNQMRARSQPSRWR